MPDKLPFQVGLTGGIGSGKSTVARLFQLLDVPVYESDETAKQLYFEPEIRKEVISLLGEPAYLSKSELNSQWIAKEIYSNPLVRVSLNEIIHPAVGRHYQNWLVQQKHPYILKVAALIFEADIYKNMDLNILVVITSHLKTLNKSVYQTLTKLNIYINKQVQDKRKENILDEGDEGKIINLDQPEILTNIQTYNAGLGLRNLVLAIDSG
jgi:dephospho-CoA kinase